jgi:hypothetical protein
VGPFLGAKGQVIANQQRQTLNEEAKKNLKLIDLSKQILDLMSRIRGR